MHFALTILLGLAPGQDSPVSPAQEVIEADDDRDAQRLEFWKLLSGTLYIGPTGHSTSFRSYRPLYGNRGGYAARQAHRRRYGARRPVVRSRGVGRVTAYRQVFPRRW